MDIDSYLSYFQSVLSAENPQPPYNDPEYLHYANLNWFRQQRWLRGGKLNSQLSSLITKINHPQHWIFITEPWCGDAAHTLPFIIKLLAFSSKIKLDIQCRDMPPYLIDHYLTGTNRSIPKLVVRNEADEDLLVWGSRPAKCQELYNKLMHNQTEHEQLHVDIQNWYNADKGVSFQAELLDMLMAITPL